MNKVYKPTVCGPNKQGHSQDKHKYTVYFLCDYYNI